MRGSLGSICHKIIDTSYNAKSRVLLICMLSRLILVCFANYVCLLHIFWYSLVISVYISNYFILFTSQISLFVFWARLKTVGSPQYHKFLQHRSVTVVYYTLQSHIPENKNTAITHYASSQDLRKCKNINSANT